MQYSIQHSIRTHLPKRAVLPDTPVVHIGALTQPWQGRAASMLQQIARLLSARCSELTEFDVTSNFRFASAQWEV